MENLLIKQKEQLTLIHFDEITYVQAFRAFCLIYFGNRKPLLLSKPLSWLEKKLDPEMYLRTHRSILVNRDMIKAIAPREKTIFLHNGTSLPVSVRKLKELASISNIPQMYKDDYQAT
jgi:two-component system, LytTR family, response regulator